MNVYMERLENASREMKMCIDSLTTLGRIRQQNDMMEKKSNNDFITYEMNLYIAALSEMMKHVHKDIQQLKKEQQDMQTQYQRMVQSMFETMVVETPLPPPSTPSLERSPLETMPTSSPALMEMREFLMQVFPDPFEVDEALLSQEMQRETSLIVSENETSSSSESEYDVPTDSLMSSMKSNDTMTTV
jgi:hypothetical protein